jgi:hypothetical protein
MRIVIGTYQNLVFGLEPLLPATDSDEKVGTLSTIFGTEAHVGTIKAVAASECGNFLCTGGVDETIR